jgi:hypothetical protein
MTIEYQPTNVTPVEPGLVARYWDRDGERIVRTEPVVAWMVRERYEVVADEPTARIYRGTEVVAAVLDPESGTLVAASTAHPNFGDVRHEDDLNRTVRRIGEADIVLLRDHNPIEKVLADYGVTLEPRGEKGDLAGVCPIHRGKADSLVVSPRRGMFHCNGCQEGGDVITLVSRIEQVGWHEAAIRLADRAGIELSANPA